MISAAFSCGIAITALIIFFALEVPHNGVNVTWWGTTIVGAGCEGQGGCARLTVPTEPGYFGPAPGGYH